MPTFEHDGVTIQYWEDGDGFPLMLFAPGGMRSVASMWGELADGKTPPWIDPRRDLSDRYRVVSMDQRNAGGSSAPVAASDGWAAYAADHVALMDHLGIDRTHLMGGCIGSSYCLGVCRAAPERVTAAVLQNPIGLTSENRGAFYAMFDSWAEDLQARRPEVGSDDLRAFRENMYGGDFVFNVDRNFVAQLRIPLLVLAGNDLYHPRAVAEEIASLAPDTELVIDWAGDEHRDRTRDRVREFLAAHT